MLNRQDLTDKLLDYLQTTPVVPDYIGAPPDSLPTFDPYQMVGESIALRQEIKQQNKLMQSVQLALQQVLAQSRIEQIPAKPSDDISAKDLLAVIDDLDRAIAYNQSQIATILATPPLQPTLWQAFFGKKPDPTLANTTSTYLAALNSNQEGIEIIRRSMLILLRQRQIVPIPALGEPFDSGYMYAISSTPSDTVPLNTVIQEVVRGYRIGDRILREAQVIVSSKSVI